MSTDAPKQPTIRLADLWFPWPDGEPSGLPDVAYLTQEAAQEACGGSQHPEDFETVFFEVSCYRDSRALEEG